MWLERHPEGFLLKGSASRGGVSRLQGTLIFRENAAITIYIDFEAHFVKFLGSKLDGSSFWRAFGLRKSIWGACSAGGMCVAQGI